MAPALSQVGLLLLPRLEPNPSELRSLAFGRPTIDKKDDPWSPKARSSLEKLPPLPQLEVKDAPGKGQGLFAVEDILALTPILADDALLSLTRNEDLPQLWERYLLLPADLKNDFDSLSFPANRAAREPALIGKLKQLSYDGETAKSMARVSSIFQANAFKTGAPSEGGANAQTSASHSDQWAYALFPKVARVNHSCIANCKAHYRTSSGQEVIYSLQDIAAGEEITIAYFDLTMPIAKRQARAESWGFRCTCAACSKTGLFQKGQYDDGLDVVHLCVSDIFLATVKDASGVGGGVARMETESAIAMAESPKYPWLKATLPRLHVRLINILRTLKRPQREIDEALSCLKEWELRTSGLSSDHGMVENGSLLT